VSDDVTDIALRLVVGGELAAPFPGYDPNINNRLGDGVNVNDVPYMNTFPYVGFAPSGRDRRHVNPGDIAPPDDGGGGGKADTTTTLSNSPNPSTFGQPVAFFANVGSSAVGPPTGTVILSIDGVQTDKASLTKGQAVFTKANFTVGSHEVAAEYTGDANFNPSTSNVVTQVVDKADTTTTLSSSPNPSIFGQPVLFTATVSSLGGSPGGALVVFRNGAPIGTAPVTNGQASFTKSSELSIGTNQIHVVYAGNANFKQSTSNVVNQVVEPSTP
jgi:hypothetical protein